MRKTAWLIMAIVLMACSGLSAQNFSFNFNTSGRRVCLVSSEVDLNNPQVKLILHDSLSNTSEPTIINRRLLGSHIWTNVAAGLAPGTGHWIDTNVASSEVWEYQVKRQSTWNYQSQNYDATGYTIGALLPDYTDYKGQMILLVSNDIPNNLATKYERLKKEITADGWFVNELIVPRATGWDSGAEVVAIKNQISSLYANAASGDKPRVIFILGHVPLPRSGSTAVVAPDDHNENKGARGCDAYYADIDGLYTDFATYNPGGLATPLAINLPGDFKWDQDFFPSDIEMAFGRIDFADLTDLASPELSLLENYLDRLSNYKRVQAGYEMGDKSAFHFGYDNSNDGSYRSLLNISGPDQVYQNYVGANHNEWVQSNGPMKVYMQNVSVPSIADWQNFGMDATVYASDQSYWGFGDVPQPGGAYSRIRALLGVETKCLVTLWTTTGINMFHQACTGEALGLAMKEIMNHNATNQYLEKPAQDYDTPEWWNRTHFAFYGDPTLNLYQVAPPMALTLSDSLGHAVLQWAASSDPNVLGYHIYESPSQYGRYVKISSSLVSGLLYQLPNYQAGHWYMVKAIKRMRSGCGEFLHSSLGESVEGTLAVHVSPSDLASGISVYPNPSQDLVYIRGLQPIQEMSLYSALGQQLIHERYADVPSTQVDLSSLENGIYLLEVMTNDGTRHATKLVKGH